MESKITTNVSNEDVEESQLPIVFGGDMGSDTSINSHSDEDDSDSNEHERDSDEFESDSDEDIGWSDSSDSSPPSLSIKIERYKAVLKWEEDAFERMFEDDESHSDEDLAHQLLNDASEDLADESVRILQNEPNLIRIGDSFGDTALHVAVRATNWDTVKNMINCLKQNHYTLLYAALSEVNAEGDTPDDIALKNGHLNAALQLLVARHKALIKTTTNTPARYSLSDDDDEVVEEENRDDKQQGLENKVQRMPVQQFEICSISVDIEMYLARSRLSLDDSEEEEEDWVLLHYAAETGEEEVIYQLLMEDPNLLKIQDPEIGDNPFHIAARNGQLVALKKMVNFVHNNRKLKMSSRLIYEANKDGNNPLHLAVERGHEETARYLTEVVPKAVCRVNKKGVSPLCLAVKKGYLDLVRRMIGIQLCQSDRDNLFEHAKMVSLANTTLNTRNLAILQEIMEGVPELINTADRKGWKPLSYAASKGYVDEVCYFLKKFRKSVRKYDMDGSLPIHKAVANRHKVVVMQFSLHCPQTLYDIDKKGRNIVDIATKYGSEDVLSYLREIKIHDKLSKLQDINFYKLDNMK